ncbi:holin [Actinoplanes sp. N902-109]|uniref:holin n=1 Tax=Actinoplanes sp. (strain N902-109) TaxID=649831 RepID=UPI00032949D5|nr:holin [Actinoplanes sp. N902-109]AGL19485.1 hypothetical protein L083_5975 [Actinoplanes sp. N902-109]
MWTKKFWKQAGERAVKSAAQALIGLWPLDQFNVLHADVPLAAGLAVGAAVLSVLTSIVTANVGEPNDPSAVARP